jgi:hypothetical protein
LFAPICVFVAVLTLGWYLALRGVDRLVVHETPDTLFLVRPCTEFWLAVAFFLGIASCSIPVNFAYKILLGDRYPRYKQYVNERVDFDADGVLAILAILIYAGAGASFLAGISSYSRFTDAGIEIASPLSFRSRFHSYRDVRGIERFATSPTLSGNRRPLAH